MPADAVVVNRGRRRLTAVLLASTAVACLPGCGRPAPTAQAAPVPKGATVLALGDSLTSGIGAPPEASYPARLADLTGWTIVNAGVPGHTSQQARERLPSLLAEHLPALVIVSVGGNDLLRRHDEAALRDNLRAICSAARAAGAQVLLVAVPRPTLAAAVTGALADHPLYAALAAEMGLPLQRQGWTEVLGDAQLRSDQIHANAQGYAQFARSLHATALATGLLARSR